MEEQVKSLLLMASTLFSYLGLETWSDVLDTTLLLCGAAFTGALVAEGLAYLWELRISLHQSLVEFRDVLQRRAPIIKRFIERRAKLLRAIERLDDEIKTLSSTQASLTNQVRLIKDIQGRHIRTIGQDVKGTTLYRAIVTNAYVKNYVREEKSHPLYDDCWARAQIIEIWSTSQADAIIALRREYTQAQGFVVDKIEPVND